MGGEAKTETSEEFKSLEEEMVLRQTGIASPLCSRCSIIEAHALIAGMDKLHSSMNTYVKSISQRKELEDKEKMLPIDVLANTMITHGEEFESDSLFGNCLISALHIPFPS